MFKNPLVRELALALAVKLVLIGVLWFAFFREPVVIGDSQSIFAPQESSPKQSDNKGRST